MGPHRVRHNWATNHIQKNQIIGLAVAWMDLTIVIMSNVSQRKTNIV